MFESLRGLVNRALPSRLTITQSLTGMIAPPVCCLCLAPGQRGVGWGLDLCIYCQAACPPALDLCPRCAQPLLGQPDAGPGCAHCRCRAAACDSVHCLFLYQAPVDSMITQLKFGHELMYARVLGTLLAQSVRNARARSGVTLPDCIVPVPLHRKRLLERGFNQSAELARHAAPRLGIKVETQLLRRPRETSAQSGLDAAARARNLDQAFAVNPGRRVARHVALLDDVLTTGSTAEAAARVLKAAGCQRVDLWVCARVLKHGPDQAL
ncbi:MAG: ComF family protein [Pseudomonadota bacterium]